MRRSRAASTTSTPSTATRPTTTVRNSRSRWTACTAIVIAVAVATVSAHRRDEYLQAARLDIASDRIEVQLDLTPGIALADRVVWEIDGDHDGVVSDAEARAYANAVEQHL